MSRRKKPEEPVVLKRLRGKRILLVDDDDIFRKSFSKALKKAGFTEIEIASSSDEAWCFFDRRHPDLVVMDIHLEEFEGDGLTLLQAFMIHGYRGLAAVVSGDNSVEQVYRGLAAGANDYWVKGIYYDPVFELIDLFERQVPESSLKWEPECIARLGFFRTCGATPKEIEATIEYAKRFSGYGEIAAMYGQSYQQLRRTYSRVKNKVGCKSLGDFGRLITLCEMMGSRQFR
jgi:CheY-like chemotaxis protein